MDDRKIAESTNSDALSHVRANRVLLACRVNEIALRMVDLRTELETLDEEIKAKVHELHEADRGIRALRVDNLSARRAGMGGDTNRHPPS
jgi:hypothetical protein